VRCGVGEWPAKPTNWWPGAAKRRDARLPEYVAVVAYGEQVTSALAMRSRRSASRPLLAGMADHDLVLGRPASARILDVDGSEIVKRFAVRNEVA